MRRAPSMQKQHAARVSLRALLLLPAAVCLSAAGCGGASGFPTTYPLKGKLVFKGGKPVTGGALLFESTTGDPPWRAGAQIEGDGSFAQVFTVRPDGKDAPGLVEGEHRVKIDLGRGGDAAERGPPVRVPARYLKFETAALKVRVPAPNDEVTIELDPK